MATPGGSDPAPSPRTRTFSFRSTVREANKRLPRDPIVYPFAKGKQRKDSGPESGIYALRQYAGTLYDDLIANQATLSQETIDGVTNSLKITPSAAPGQAQITLPTTKGSVHRLTYRYYTNSVSAAGRIVVYDGDQRGFGASEPSQIAASSAFRSVSEWTEATLDFTAESSTVTIGMEATDPEVCWIRSIEIFRVSGSDV